MVAEVITALLGGAAGEAGKSAWGSLVGLVRQRFGKDSTEVAALESADASSAQRVIDLVVDRARADAGFDEALTTWAQQSQHLTQAWHVSNTISGDARVHGNSIQAGQIGSITFGQQ